MSACRWSCSWSVGSVRMSGRLKTRWPVSATPTTSRYSIAFGSPSAHSCDRDVTYRPGESWTGGVNWHYHVELLISLTIVSESRPSTVSACKLAEIFTQFNSRILIDYSFFLFLFLSYFTSHQPLPPAWSAAKSLCMFMQTLLMYSIWWFLRVNINTGNLLSLRGDNVLRSNI